MKEAGLEQEELLLSGLSSCTYFTRSCSVLIGLEYVLT